MIIAVDFDGTIVEHNYPSIGEPIKNSFKYLKKLKEDGHKLILWTCRSNDHFGDMLDLAVNFCREKGVEFDQVNENIKDISFQPSPKIYADVYIDDRQINGMPSWIEIYNYIGFLETKRCMEKEMLQKKKY